jgi:hypothetical protein
MVDEKLPSEVNHPERPKPLSENFEDWPEYRKRKLEYQAIWRERIFQRDGRQCQWCHITQGEAPLELAHITDCKDFYLARHNMDDIEKSYSEDNLTTLCVQCHKAQTGTLPSMFTPELRELFNKRKKLRDDPDLRVYFELVAMPKVREFYGIQTQIDTLHAKAVENAKALRDDVCKFMEDLKAKRGWHDATQVIDKVQSTSGVKTPELSAREMRMWLDKGWLPAVWCDFPGGAQEMERFDLRDCVRGPMGCKGNSVICPDCHIYYCESHMPGHNKHA